MANSINWVTDTKNPTSYGIAIAPATDGYDNATDNYDGTLLAASDPMITYDDYFLVINSTTYTTQTKNITNWS